VNAAGHVQPRQPDAFVTDIHRDVGWNLAEQRPDTLGKVQEGLECGAIEVLQELDELTFGTAAVHAANRKHDLQS
jgi:hypothetical protein